MMNKKEIFRKIGGIISELTEQYQYLSENLDNLNELELELFTANSKFLTDHAEIFKKLNSSAPPAATVATGQPDTNEPQEEEERFAEKSPESTPKEPEAELPVEVEEEEEAPEPVEESPADESEENHAGATEEAVEKQSESHFYPDFQSEPEPEPQPEPQAEPEPAPSQPGSEEEMVNEVVIPEKIVHVEVAAPVSEEPAPRPTLNDLMSARKNPDSASPAFRPQISDLKAAISLNDKLLFIRELFNGYSLAYSEAIEILNRFESFDAADTFLKSNYAEKNLWASKQPVVDKLYELLRKRYLL